VSDLDNDDERLGVVDRIEHAVVPLAEAELILAGKFLTTRRPGFFCKSSDLRDEALAVLQWDGLDFLGRPRRV
jgi:hypothetical protein